ncbi:PTS sugar transporter subunit IIA [Streptococcus cuniculi]|uniref:PTS sugar transporter subunit IIA n=1 Tax=Streptococcus cuniculi TaxID=1432788 RepID=A0A4Y9JAK5_9STRE|nr:PTS sugar transporter subunit IIA [Streptococcus cuniculi]MBF0778232.1 PTS sugar transporter subunit IIA [Streptococcus cuniculi]TFU97972.1 PTS sugar transporter subunit IIA [Streptococcus cuniculi]
MYKDMLQADLVKLDCNVSNHVDLFQLIGKELKEKGYVTDQYVEALLEREQQFPTGLKTKFVNIAIPHTDPQVIEKPFIFIVKNSTPLDMLQMGDNSEMTCCYFMFLGIKDPTGQVGLLAKLMEVFSQEAFVQEFVQTTTDLDMYQLVNHYL